MTFMATGLARRAAAAGRSDAFHRFLALHPAPGVFFFGRGGVVQPASRLRSFFFVFFFFWGGAGYLFLFFFSFCFLYLFWGEGVRFLRMLVLVFRFWVGLVVGFPFNPLTVLLARDLRTAQFRLLCGFASIANNCIAASLGEQTH